MGGPDFPIDHMNDNSIPGDFNDEKSCPLQIRPPIKLRACHAGYKIAENHGPDT
jgi:hypothetical protein